jgi:hypothetical protein
MKIPKLELPRNWRLGATGRFPRGHADASDEGEIRLAVAADHQQGIVRLLFGKRVAWLGLPSTEARALAAVLLEKAEELDRHLT